MAMKTRAAQRRRRTRRKKPTWSLTALTSTVKDDGSQKLVITKTVETITTGEDGSKRVTKSVTVTETVKEEVEEVKEEVLVSTKKTEKHSSLSVKQVTEEE
ncbi:Neurofilament medium polypeptide [Dissostichus eleginoides]|uniref:Neurofilament medium polypeptide n=1 Tax=Dissostichus eleginoides TaxID=100907 RepID=A0AAD9BLU1_DISEL|nr:Neurofilament medium polypeptide [Dissostichus eleginoides]